MHQKTRKLLERISQKHNGFITVLEVRKSGISTNTIYRLRDAGEIVCISRGVYQIVDSDTTPHVSPEYAAIKARIPHAVLCTISALYHHDLTTEIPRTVHLAIKRNHAIPKIDHPAIQFYRMAETIFSTGIETKEIGGIMMNIFSPEKTIADCFRYRNRLGIELAIEGLKKYLQRPNAKPTKILTMAKICRVKEIIKPYLEATV